MAFIYDLTDTWNAGGTTFNAIKMNVTDSASAAASRLISLQVGGAERFSVDKAGNVLIGNGGDLQISSATGGNNSTLYNDAQDLYIATNGSARMYINSSGNVGIGNVSPGTRLDVTGNIRLSAGAPVIEWNNGGAQVYAPAANTLAIATGGGIGSPVERMRIDSSGNVGIGTSAPSSYGRLSVSGNVVLGPLTRNQATTQSVGVWTTGDPADDVRANIGFTTVAGAASSSSFITFATNNYGVSGGERMRIDASGNLLVGKTSTATSVTGFVALPTGFTATNANAEAGDMNRQSSDGALLLFRRAQTQVGSISVTASSTSYNTSSDYRLKDIDGPIQNSGAYIDALKPVQGSWKVDGSRFIGLLAHEVQEVSETQIATGEKDGEQMQAMDYSAPEIIANLIAELQSLRARVAQLEGN